MNMHLSVLSESTLLIIDDTSANLEIATNCLASYGLRILIAEEGLEGVYRAKRTLPDLILLDVMLPDIDGFEVCYQLKQDPKTSSIPIIFMTALNEGEYKLKGFQAGGVDYITKPFDLEELTARIGLHLTLEKQKKQLHEKNDRLELAYQELKTVNQALEMAQHQAYQSEKMASIGQLAAGVAHEINNPISYVFSNINTLESYINDMISLIHAYHHTESYLLDPIKKSAIQTHREKIDLDFLISDTMMLMSESKEGIQRVRQIVQDLKDFSHTNSTEEWTYSHIEAGLLSTLNIVNNELKYCAHVRKEFVRLPEIYCIPSQLNQVFMNLLVNAAHAIQGSGTEHKKGIITLRTGKDNDTIWVEIEDNGSGIDPAIVNKIFDPFFTTKPIGKGTGLGLSLSYGIIKKHQGTIEVRSELGVGTCFKITLPINKKLCHDP